MATTHDDPTYEVDGIIHYCVANMPGAVPVTSAHALNNATLQYGLQLADQGLKAMLDDKHLRNGLKSTRAASPTGRGRALGYEMAESQAILKVA
jgi:alanine dehydrogenase